MYSTTTAYDDTPYKFMQDFYCLLAVNIKKIISLNKQDATTAETQEMFETKSKVLDSLNYLSMNGNDEELMKLCNLLGTLIVSNDNKKLNLSLECCESLMSK